MLFVIGVFAAPHFSFAMTNQPDASTLVGNGAGNTVTESSFIGDGSVITSITVVGNFYDPDNGGYPTGFNPSIYGGVFTTNGIGNNGCTGSYSGTNIQYGPYTMVTSTVAGQPAVTYVFTNPTSTANGLCANLDIDFGIVHDNGTGVYGVYGAPTLVSGFSALYYGNRGTQSPYLVWNGYTPPSGPSRFTSGFIFPTSTYVGPDFSNWAIRISSLATNTVYTGSVVYQVGNVFNNNGNQYQDYFSLNSGNSTSVVWTVPKSHSLFSYQNNNGTTSLWLADVYDLSHGPAPSSSEVVFTITPFATSTPTSPGANLAGPFFYNAVQPFTGGSYFPQSLASSSALLAGMCTPASDWTDIGGGLAYAGCSIINYLFVPSDSSVNNFANSILAMESVPPFSFFFAITNSVSSSISSAGTSSIALVSPEFMDNINGHTTTVDIIPGDPTANAFLGTAKGRALVNTWYNLFLEAGIFLIMLLGLALIFGGKRTSK